MKQFKEVTVSIENSDQGEIVVSLFSDMDIEGMSETEGEIKIFIDQDKFDEQEIKDILDPYHLGYQVSSVENRNWNEEWEAGYKPVIIDNKVAIRARFHEPVMNIPYEIIITPKMSFGTGHHATTALMIRMMGQIDFSDKTVLDFGTGTAVLAILAHKFSAGLVTATDNDEWSIKNAEENILNNNCKKITVLHTAEVNKLGVFDVIFANINLNVLTANAGDLKEICRTGGFIILSGFYETDLEELRKYFDQTSFNLIEQLTLENWCCILLERN